MNRLLVGVAILAAQVSTGPAKNPRLDPGAVCCAITAIDAKAGTVTAKVTATGQAFTLNDIPADAIGSFKVGATLDLACAVPPNSGTTGASGNAANSGTPPTTTAPKLPWVTSTSCGTPGTTGTGTTGGTNVPRDSRTTSTQPPPRNRPGPECVATTGTGARVTMPCPDGVQVRSGK
jgi:hypothetical protein